jgi:hypothetical protein
MYANYLLWYGSENKIIAWVYKFHSRADIQVHMQKASISNRSI